MKYIIDTPKDLIDSFTNYIERPLEYLKANQKSDNIVCLNFLVGKLRTTFNLTFKDIGLLLGMSESRAYRKYIVQKDSIYSKHWQEVFNKFNGLIEIKTEEKPIKPPYIFLDRGIDDLIEYIKYEFDSTYDILVDKTKYNTKDVANLMFVISWVLRYKFKLSLKAISDKLQYPNHTSALYNLKQFVNIYNTDKNYKEKVNQCIENIDSDLINYVNCPVLRAEKVVNFTVYRFKCLEDDIKFTTVKQLADYYNLSEWQIIKSFKIDKKVIFKGINKTIEKFYEKVRF